MIAQNLYSSNYTETDVLIIGGGLSGLNAARILSQELPEASIALIEARDRLGGRTNTIDINGELVECGGEMIDRGHKYALNLLKELGM
jgi:protoporphyrinogen oxidase